MKADQAVRRLGGVATRSHLRLLSHWRQIDAALAEGSITRTGRGHYVLAGMSEARASAHRLSGHASHTTAALRWGWKVKVAPSVPHVTIRSKRSLRKGARDGVVLHWRDLLPDEIDGWSTTPVRTIIDCCLDLPFDEALSVCDSALRGGERIGPIIEHALWLTLRQQRRVLGVVNHADGKAANPFESALRAIAIGVKGLEVQAQVVIKDAHFFARVDLADEELRIVIEADSHEFHSSRKDLNRDAHRYDELGLRGWLVLRFTWEQVMFQPDWVRTCLERAVALRRVK